MNKHIYAVLGIYPPKLQRRGRVHVPRLVLICKIQISNRQEYQSHLEKSGRRGQPAFAKATAWWNKFITLFGKAESQSSNKCYRLFGQKLK